jgi:hypothetical protein
LVGKEGERRVEVGARKKRAGGVSAFGSAFLFLILLLSFRGIQHHPEMP